MWTRFRALKLRVVLLFMGVVMSFGTGKHKLCYSMIFISSDGTRYEDETMGNLVNVPASAATYMVKKEVVTVSGSAEKAGAFYHESGPLTTLSFETGSRLTTLESWAGAHCTALVTVDMSQCTLLKEISHACFAYCTSLASVTLPPKLVNLSASSFYKCASLTKITIPDSVERIETYAAPGGVFAGCTALSEVVLTTSSKLTYIGWHAFTDAAITSFMIPPKVSTISIDNPFIGCNSLSSITVASGNTNFKISNGFLVKRDGTTIYAYPPAKASVVTLPENTKYLGAVFRNNKLVTSITLSSTLQVIYGHGVVGCSSLTTLAFSTKGCALTKLNDNSIATLPLLKSFKIPKTLTYLGGGVFGDCPLLDLSCESGGAFKIADGLLSQGTIIKLFWSTSTTVTVPDTYTEFARNAFKSNTIESVTVTTKITTLPPQLARLGPNLKTFTAKGVTVVENECFDLCRKLHTVTLGKVTKLGYLAFSSCDSLVNVNIEFSSLTTLEHGVFKGTPISSFDCSSSNLKVIDYSCFEKCSQLKSISIPSGVTTIGNNAFSLSGVEKVRFSGTVITEIGYRAFYQAVNLKEIVVPTTVTTLGKECFAMCSSLVDLVLPSAVAKIGELAFEGCSALETLTIQCTAAMTLTAGAFIGCMSFSDIIIAENHPSFSYEKGVVLYDKQRTEILVYLAGCSNTKFTIPDTVVRVAAHAFDYAIHLKSVVIPNSGKITNIGYRAFHYCKGLTRLVIPDSVTSVGHEAFLNTNIVECDSVVYPPALKDALIAARIDQRCLEACPPTMTFTAYALAAPVNTEILKCAAGLIFSLIHM